MIILRAAIIAADRDLAAPSTWSRAAQPLEVGPEQLRLVNSSKSECSVQNDMPVSPETAPRSPARKPSTINLADHEVVVDVALSEFHRPDGHGLHVGDRVQYTMKVTSNFNRSWEVLRSYTEFKNLNKCTANFRHPEHQFPTITAASWWHEIFDPACVNEEHIIEQLHDWLRDLIGWCHKSEELQFYLHVFLNLGGKPGLPPDDFQAPTVGYVPPDLLWSGILLSFFGI